MQAWEQALELRNELYEWWGSEIGRRFSAGWSAARAGSYSGAPPVGAIEAVKLQIAPPYYITAEMVDLLEHASKSLPRTVLLPTDPLTDSGFALFSRPVVFPDVHDNDQYISCFAWAMTGDPEDGEDPSGLHMTLYAHREHDTVHRDMDRMATEQFGHWQFPTLSLVHESPWTFGTDYSDPERWTTGTITNVGKEFPPEALQGGVWMERVLHTFFILAKQEIAQPSEYEASRPVRKRAGRIMPQREIPTVKVVTLRRYRDDPDADVDPESRGREYSHRWIRNGHWRMQAYGPGRSQRRPKYIAPHVCGPKDKPLVLKDTAYVWRR